MEQRPKRRNDCYEMSRPCPYVGCEGHVYLTVDRLGRVKINFPDKEPWELEHSCVFDVIDLWGSCNQKEISEILNISPNRVKEIENKAVRKCRQHAWRLHDFK